MIKVNCTVNDGAGGVYKLNENIPEHLTYIHCAVKEDYARKELERLQRNPRYFDNSYFDQLKNAHDKVSKLHEASSKALGECFDEYKETPLPEGEPMPNEIIRPCTLPAHWKQTEPFDAMKVHSVIVTLELIRKEEIVLVRVRDEEDGFIYIKHPTSPNHKEADLLQEAITTIANALNAPVLATEEVLAGLPKDAKAFVVLSTGNMCKMTWAKDCWEIRDGDYYMEVEPEDSFRIIPDKNDPKTAECLRQFTLDGVRIKEKETSHD